MPQNCSVLPQLEEWDHSVLPATLDLQDKQGIPTLVPSLVLPQGCCVDIGSSKSNF